MRATSAAKASRSAMTLSRTVAVPTSRRCRVMMAAWAAAPCCARAAVARANSPCTRSQASCSSSLAACIVCASRMAAPSAAASWARATCTEVPSSFQDRATPRASELFWPKPAALVSRSMAVALMVGANVVHDDSAPVSWAPRSARAAMMAGSVPRLASSTASSGCRSSAISEGTPMISSPVNVDSWRAAFLICTSAPTST